VIVLEIITSDGTTSVTVSSVSDSQTSITWQSAARSSATYCSSTQKSTMIEWYGIAASPLTSDTINLHLSTTPISASAISFAISGADTVTPFDPYSSLPKATTACSTTAAAPSIASVYTTADEDFVFGLFGGYTPASETAGSIGSSTATLAQSVTGAGDSSAMEYSTTTQPLSPGPCNFGTTTTYWKILCDAVMPARQSVSITYETANSDGSVHSTMISGAQGTLTALYAPISLASSAGTIPSGGYILVVITAPSNEALTVFWGEGNPTLFEVQFTYQA
jgi:hypothetical protein